MHLLTHWAPVMLRTGVGLPVEGISAWPSWREGAMSLGDGQGCSLSSASSVPRNCFLCLAEENEVGCPEGFKLDTQGEFCVGEHPLPTLA